MAGPVSARPIIPLDGRKEFIGKPVTRFLQLRCAEAAIGSLYWTVRVGRSNTRHPLTNMALVA